MKTLWKICKLVFMLLLTGVIVWTILYFTVPKVKDWTNDKVLKIDQSKDDEEKKQLRAENEDLKKQINSLTTEATTVSAELTNVKDQLTAKTSALETATSEKQELTSKVSKLEQKVSELETSGAATQTELEAKKQELATAQTSLQEKTAEVETLTSEKQTLENQKTTLESQLAEKQNQIQELQNRVEQLEAELNPDTDAIYLRDVIYKNHSSVIGVFDGNSTYNIVIVKENRNNTSTNVIYLENKNTKKLTFVQNDLSNMDYGEILKINENLFAIQSSYGFHLLNLEQSTCTKINISNDYTCYINKTSNGILITSGNHFYTYNIENAELTKYSTCNGEALPSGLHFLISKNNKSYISVDSGKDMYVFNEQTSTISKKTTQFTYYPDYNMLSIGVINCSSGFYFMSKTGQLLCCNTTTDSVSLYAEPGNTCILFDGKYLLYTNNGNLYMEIINEANIELSIPTDFSLPSRNYGDRYDGVLNWLEKDSDGFAVNTYSGSKKISEGVYSFNGWVFDFTKMFSSRTDLCLTKES